VARGAAFLASDPAGAAAALNDDPHGVGQVLGEVAATAAMASLAKPGEAGTTCSFSADTPVATPDGPTSIGNLQVGDTVLAYNPQRGVTGRYSVTAVLSHTDVLRVDLTIDSELLHTTPEHPFFVQDRGWMPAGLLRPGDHIRRLDGTTGTVQSLIVVAHPQVMYNLTVAVAHTFFVGNSELLVHNTCNPFKGKNPNEIDKMFREKGFDPRGPDPANGKGGYVNPRTNRSYHIDEANSFGESPHVDVNRPRDYRGSLPKRKFPM
jgi:hypothetical protein